MKDQLKALAREGLVYGVALALRRAVGFLMIPVYTRFLTPSDYGLLELVDLVGMIAAFFMSLGLMKASFRFYAAADSAAMRRRVQTNCLMALFGFGGLFTVVSSLGAKWIAQLAVGTAEHARLVAIMLASTFLMEAASLLLAYLRSEGRALRFSLFSLGATGLRVAANLVALAVFDAGVAGILIASLLVSAVLFGWLAIERLPGGGWEFDLPMVRRMLNYALPFVPMGLLAFTTNFADRFFLRVLTDMEAVGHYALAYKVGMAIGFAIGMPFNLVWDPRAFDIAKTDNARATYGRVVSYLFAALALGATALSLFAHEIITLMADDAYAAAAPVVPWIAWSVVLLNVSPVLQIGLLLERRTGYLPVVWTATTALNLGLNAILIPRIGMHGAASATLIAFLAHAVVIALVSQRVYPIRYERIRLSALVATSLAVIALAAILPRDLGLVTVLGKVGLLVLWPALLWLVPGGVAHDEREWLRRVLSELHPRHANV